MKFISPSQIMQMAIAQAIRSKFEISLNPEAININVCYPQYDAHYTSTIALAIANRLGLDAYQIAEAIAQTCSQNPEICLRWQVKAFGKGWLNILLSEKYIAESLLALDVWQPQTYAIDKLRTQSPEAIAQYAYARCCALIRLAHAYPDILGCNSKISGGLEPVEISLLLQQMAIAEHLCSTPIISNKLSRSLAAAFLQFYDRCRIFGVSPDLVYQRLLLIKITQKLLLAIAPPDANYLTYL